MEVKHSDRKHATFSASASKRWMTCPGSIRLSKSAPPQQESQWAKEGTEAHECLEFIVKRFSNLERAKGEALKKWPAEMVEHCVRAAGIIFELRPSPSARLYTEQRVNVKGIGHGTLDYAWVEDWGKVLVSDFKYGAGVRVDAVDEDGEPNSQLMYYALGLLQKLGDDFESICLAVIQPRVYADDELPVSATTVSMREVKAFEKKLRDAVAQAKSPNARLVSGDHCRFCPASAICPELSKGAMEKADVVFDVASSEILASPEILSLTPETLPKILAACDSLETWIDAVRARAFDLANAGAEIPGWKLVAKRAQRIWDPGAIEAATAQFGTGNVFLASPLTPAQFEKQNGKAGKDFTAKHTSAVSSGFNLVPEKHKSPAVKTTSVFDH